MPKEKPSKKLMNVISHSSWAKWRVFASMYFYKERARAPCFRTIPTKILTLEELGMPPILKQMCEKEKGLILVTGPTGSGKSTTLAAMIDYLNNTFEGHILTVEDPIEFVHQSKNAWSTSASWGRTLTLSPTRCGPLCVKTPISFWSAKCATLETIQLALTAAETGHIVFGTLHTSSAPKTVDRIIDVFPPTQQSQIRAQFAESIEAVLTQTLLKKKAGGRAAALEILTGTTAVRNLIREGKIHQIPGTMQVSQKDGMQTMDMALTNLVSRGVVTREEAQSKSMTANLFGAAPTRRRRRAHLERTKKKDFLETTVNIEDFFRKMVEIEASDLYLTVAKPPMYRTEGKIEVGGDHPFTPEELRDIAQAIMNDKQKQEFTETMEMNMAMSLPGVSRFRVNIFQQRGSVGMVIRRIKADVLSVEQMGLPAILGDIVMTKRGLVLVVGATGSGKSTSLAAMIDHRNTHEAGHIITIEDPIEFVHRHKRSIITQREVGFDTHSFQAALKNTLRQAPDVILIGEIRDTETMEAAITFAETGHLCPGTLHSNNANQAIERIMNFSPPSAMHRSICSFL